MDFQTKSMVGSSMPALFFMPICLDYVHECAIIMYIKKGA